MPGYCAYKTLNFALAKVFSDLIAMPISALGVKPDQRGAALALVATTANAAACIVILLSGLVIGAMGGLQSALNWQCLIVLFAFGSAVTSFSMHLLGRSG